MNAPVQVQSIATDSPPKLPTLSAGGAVRAIVPQDFDSAWRIANAVVKAGMAPRGLDTAEKAMVAIMHGLEIGLTPMNALQSIAVVNGRPTIYGDGAIGLVRGSGLLEWIEEIEEQRPNQGLTAICRVKRRGEPKPAEYTFSEADAKTAGLSGKEGPWRGYPRRMRQMRARAFALRDTFADVLKGLSIREEIEDFQPMRDVSPRDDGPPAPPSKQSLVPEIASRQTEVELVEAGRDDGTKVEWTEDGETASPATAPTEAAFDQQSEKDWLNELSGAFSSCENIEQFSIKQKDCMAPKKGHVSPEAWTAAQRLAEDTYHRVKEN